MMYRGLQNHKGIAMSYIGTEPKDIRSFGRTKFDYTATQGQTAFTGADGDGKVLAFTVGQIEVYVNGILMDDSDFTTTGTGTVTLASAANLNDVVNVVSFETNIPDSNYVPATGGTFSGDVDFGANKITYANLYAQLSDLPSASTYHGMFAHVHATGLAYYAHAGAWIPLASGVGIDDNSNATAITIDSSENVMVGKTATNYQTVGVEAKPDGSLFATANNNGPLVVTRKSSVGNIASFYKDTTNVGNIGTAGNQLYIHGAGTDVGLYCGSNNLYPYRSTGLNDATIDIGQSSKRFRDIYLSGGAYLGGTGAANKLSDYETGNWTAANSEGITVTAYNTTYIKIGRKVYLQFYFVLGSNSNGSGCTISGLPFTPTDSYSSGLINSGQSTAYCFQVDSTSTVMRVKSTNNGHVSNSTMSGQYMIGNVTYSTAS